MKKTIQFLLLLIAGTFSANVTAQNSATTADIFAAFDRLVTEGKTHRTMQGQCAGMTVQLPNRYQVWTSDEAESLPFLAPSSGEEYMSLKKVTNKRIVWENRYGTMNIVVTFHTNGRTTHSVNAGPTKAVRGGVEQGFLSEALWYLQKIQDSKFLATPEPDVKTATLTELLHYDIVHCTGDTIVRSLDGKVELVAQNPKQIQMNLFDGSGGYMFICHDQDSDVLLGFNTQKRVYQNADHQWAEVGNLAIKLLTNNGCPVSLSEVGPISNASLKK